MRLLPIEHIEKFNDAELLHAITETQVEASRLWDEWVVVCTEDCLNAWRYCNYYEGALQNDLTRRIVIQNRKACIQELRPRAGKWGSAGAVCI